MRKHSPPVERLVEVAHDVNIWLSRLGNACCAGTSYRRIDKAKGQPDCQQSGPGNGPAEEVSRTVRSGLVDKEVIGLPDAERSPSLS